MRGKWIDRLAATITQHSINVQPGELVIISGTPAAEPLILRLFDHLVQRQALSVLRLSTDICLDTELRSGNDRRERYVNPFGVSDGTPIDCSIGIWTYDEQRVPNHGGEIIPSGRSPSDVQTDFLSAASRDLRWTVVLFPTDAAATEAGMPLPEFQDLIVRSAFLDTPRPSESWLNLNKVHSRLSDELSRAELIRVVTAHGTDLSLNVLNRVWISSDGHSNLPDGEIFTSPWETSATGVFVADSAIRHDSQRIDGIRLQFREGKVVDARAQVGEEHLFRLLSSDEGACRIGEFGIGTNPHLLSPTGVSLLDEKIAGTLHIALGSSYPATGGNNVSAIHRDLITDPRRGGKFEVNGKKLNLKKLLRPPN